MNKVIIAGSRDFDNYVYAETKLLSYFKENGIHSTDIEIISGGARGADKIGEKNTMKIVNLIDEDFCQYKKPSMFIGFPTCSFKCDKECGRPICQNSALAAAPQIEMDAVEIAKRYYENPITEAVVFGGLEPFDSFADMVELISHLVCCHTLYPDEPKPDIVIYTGYRVWEIKDKIKMLDIYRDMNIIIKFGRFIPDQKSHMDETLGVELASPNQYALPLKTIIHSIEVSENYRKLIIEGLSEDLKEEKTHENK